MTYTATVQFYFAGVPSLDDLALRPLKFAEQPFHEVE